MLADLGYRCGSVSSPGQVFLYKHVGSADVPFDPHRGHAYFRLLPGDLAFANMPITVDTSKYVEKDGRWFFWDLRPDFDGFDYSKIAHNVAVQLRERAPAVTCINMLIY